MSERMKVVGENAQKAVRWGWNAMERKKPAGKNFRFPRCFLPLPLKPRAAAPARIAVLSIPLSISQTYFTEIKVYTYSGIDLSILLLTGGHILSREDILSVCLFVQTGTGIASQLNYVEHGCRYRLLRFDS
jgi:hypothetical protein